ncbi:MAG: hypothetical protein IJR61_00205 [Clostridia bacterium]|nr:hypothetical protein [Clostridia bacterium]
MKLSKKTISIISIIVAAVLVVSAVAVVLVLTVGKSGKNKDSIVIMTEDVSGLFNPFYATTGADMGVVGLTQISMLSTDEKANPVASETEPTAVLAFETKQNDDGDTVYTFVLKNGIVFSDGEPLTMNDVMFNLYEYLDPVYTGSSTMYSTKIKGLAEYRTQTHYASQEQSDKAQSDLTINANSMGGDRLYELIDVFQTEGETGTNTYSLSQSAMQAAISAWDVSDGYKEAVSNDELTDVEYRAKLKEDYEFALKTFKEELEQDFRSAREAFDLESDSSPYKEHASLLQNDVFKFYLYEGYITPKYEEVQGKKNRNKILSFDNTGIASDTQEQAIARVFNDKVTTELNIVLSYWATAGTLQTRFAADAMSLLLHDAAQGDGLEFPNIEGIESLGHTTTIDKVTVNGKEYKVASSHDEKGRPAVAGEYDVLRITIDGTDPKAIFSFGFSVAPAHYYTADSAHPNGRTIDIANNKFGVEYADSDFQTNVIQSPLHVGVPVGAGAYKATDRDNGDNPTPSSFNNSNIIYYKSNDSFLLGAPKAKKIRYQVVSSANALDALENGQIDFATPQFTQANARRLASMTKKGFGQLDSWQLGYGYIGINAGKVKNLNIRKAIMAAMQTDLAVGYYEVGTAKQINWPMSMESWAYPWADRPNNTEQKQNGHDYTQWRGVDAAKAKIQDLMNAAGVQAGDAQLKITFTIAGASITEHPTYSVFKQAAEILNSMGWEVEVKPDSQALTKLATGSLEVWAAAWGSSLDPDMYQVYHRNSTATSTYAWGYREIKANTTLYNEEWEIIKNLSDVIDEAREKLEQSERIPLYEDALGYVLDLAVEMPVYQRKNLYAYNAKRIKGLTETVNPYTSPLEKIWEHELV